MNTKQILTGIQEASCKESKACKDKPMKKDDILWMLFDRSWAKDLMGGGNAIEHEFYK